MGLRLLILKGLARGLNQIEKGVTSPGPVFWRGKDITGRYHDKKELQQATKERKNREKKNK